MFSFALVLTTLAVLSNSDALHSMKLRQGPVFIYEPPIKLVFLNSNGASVDCSAHGIPDPEIRWFREDGLPVVNVPNLLKVLKNGTLLFEKFESEDYQQMIHAASYRCSAANKHGKILSRSIYIRAAVTQPYEVQVYDEYVIKGNTAVMKCHVPSFVKDFVQVVAWIRSDNYQITSTSAPSGRYSVFEDGRLHIRNINDLDNNIAYWCKTKHSLSKKIQISVTPGNLKVSEPKNSVVPRMTHSNVELEVKNGKSIEIPCSAQGWPTPSYRWFKQGKNKSEEIRGMSKKYKRIGGSLFIYEFMRQDVGAYLCEVNNNVGSTSSVTNIYLKDHLSAYIDPQQVEVDSGKSANLTCLVTSSKLYDVLWLKDGRTISTSKITNIESEEEAYSLFISSVHRENEGMYQCHVKSESEGVQGTAEIILGSDTPMFIKTFGKRLKKKSEQIKLTCVATGNPQPILKWKINNNILLPSSRVRIQNDNVDVMQTKSTLTIRQAKVSDGGLYSCIASNKAGKVSHSNRIDIYGPPNIRKMENLTAVSGTDARLECLTFGYPIKSIIWTRESGLLKIGERSEDLGNGTLIIRKTNAITDSGKYTCTVSNYEMETVKIDVQLKIIVKPMIQPITKQVVKEGGKVSLTCSIIEGDPPIEIKWLKDRQRLPHSLGIKILSVEDMSILQIPSVHSVHNGNYTCTANNIAGNNSETAEIRVKVPPAWLHKPINKTVSLFHDIEFKCLADGYPLPNITWFKLKDDEEHIMKEIKDRVILKNSALKLINVTQEDTGKYLCKISNGVGPLLEHKVMLKISYKPHVVITSHNKINAIGDTTKLRCVGIGEGDLKVDWFKDNKILQSDKTHRLVESVVMKSVISSLWINEVQSTDAGLYQCSVTNFHGIGIDTFILEVKEPPGAPTQVSVKKHDSGLLLRWKEPHKGKKEIINYIIQRQIKKGEWLNTSVPSSMTTYILTGLEKKYHHKIRLMAQNSVGLSPPSQEISFEVNQNGAIVIEEPKVANLNWWSKSSFTYYLIIIPSAIVLLIIFVIMVLLFVKYKQRKSKDHVSESICNREESMNIAETEIEDKLFSQENYYNTSTFARRSKDSKDFRQELDRRSDNSGYYSSVSPYAMFRLQENEYNDRKQRRKSPDDIYESYQSSHYDKNNC